jgi:hypothetical protein
VAKRSSRNWTTRFVFISRSRPTSTWPWVSSATRAIRRAQLAFGGDDRFAEECRDARGISWLEQTGQDVRYAARGLWRGRGFTAIAVLSLALGIGATTSVFAVLDAVMLRGAPCAGGASARGHSAAGSRPAFRAVQPSVRGIATPAACARRHGGDLGFELSGRDPSGIAGADLSRRQLRLWKLFSPAAASSPRSDGS